uniref:Chemokine interleukin-8-like domain-containing protein n=2 Tax=Sinocyclocheilus rhinocerous TaxID=307959 RepID=A0A673KLU7_9TELE
METRRILMRSLAVAVVMVSVIWTTTAAGDVVYSCCTKVSTAKVTDPIIEIRMQRESLPCVKAVMKYSVLIFHRCFPHILNYTLQCVVFYEKKMSINIKITSMYVTDFFFLRVYSIFYCNILDCN